MIFTDKAAAVAATGLTDNVYAVIRGDKTEYVVAKTAAEARVIHHQCAGYSVGRVEVELSADEQMARKFAANPELLKRLG